VAPVEERFDMSEEVSRHLLGTGDSSALHLLRAIPDLQARARGNQLVLTGDPERIALVRRFLEILTARTARDQGIDKAEIRHLLTECLAQGSAACAPGSEPTRDENQGPVAPAVETNGREPGGNGRRPDPFPEIIQTHAGRLVRARTAMQQAYVESMRTRDITVGIGPAGTGKTYLAIAMAVRALRDKKVSRVILSRPTVEAGENLGYLPGDLLEKVDPHFRPLYDALQEFLGTSRFQQLMRQEILEITPLAYMRGRTFNEAFIVLDEAQNTTPRQMRMFLTRMGYGSRVVVTGDQTQIDLPRAQDSSLHHLEEILGTIEQIDFIRLGEQDVIRHELVRKIIRAYETYYGDQEKKP
jgi:phosphate starvation-inducible protein PhoH